jgi:dTDP-4-amino-4,6-dideoxygalactose transaminase
MQNMKSNLKEVVSKVPLLDVNRGNSDLRDEILEAIAQVVDSGKFLHGPEVTVLEKEVAQVCGTKHGISCASGSDALLLALMALNIQSGDEVIVPSFTFFATASCVTRVGAKIVFADIDPKTFNIDPACVARKITSKTKAIIPVHLFGQCAAMDELCNLAKGRGIAVIEDAAQAIGAAYKDRFAGNWGDMGCLSFYPTKNLGGMGDGGMMVCNNDELASSLRLYAAHGMQPRYHHHVVGINSRLDTIQAAILSIKLRKLDEYTAARQQNAARYFQMFKDYRLSEAIELPYQMPDTLHVWNQFGIRVKSGSRDALRKHLQDNNVGCEIYYPLPLHLQPCYQSCNYKVGSLPETERAAAEILHIPVYPELTLAEQETVVSRIRRFYADGMYKRAA